MHVILKRVYIAVPLEISVMEIGGMRLCFLEQQIKTASTEKFKPDLIRGMFLSSS
jgi:hypothetical protein